MEFAPSLITRARVEGLGLPKPPAIASLRPKGLRCAIAKGL